MPGRLWRHIGRRGCALLWLALVDLVYAASLAAPPAQDRSSPTMTWLAHIAPLPAWAGAWAGVGVACLAGAFRRRDGFAFAAAMGLKVLWGVVLFGGWLLADVERGYSSTVVWLGLAALVYVISTWPEPAPPPTGGQR